MQMVGCVDLCLLDASRRNVYSTLGREFEIAYQYQAAGYLWGIFLVGRFAMDKYPSRKWINPSITGGANHCRMSRYV